MNHKLCTKTLQSGLLCTEKVLSYLVVDKVNRSVCCTLREWWLQHQDDLLEDVSQKANMFMALQGT